MSVKTDIQTDINNINDGGLNTASEVRNFADALLENSYGDVVTDDQTTTNVLTAYDAANYQYEIRAVKQGRKVILTGYLLNNTASIINNTLFCEITGSDYIPTSDGIVCYGNNNLDGSPVKINISGIHPTMYLTLVDALGAGEIVEFSLTYFTNN